MRGNRGEADDITQEVFAKVHLSIGELLGVLCRVDTSPSTVRIEKATAGAAEDQRRNRRPLWNG
jgi:hypothetical protein